MKVHDAIMTRRSIRKFEDRDIPEGHIEKLMDALIWAPSAGNLQSRKFYLVKDKETKIALGRAALGQNFISRAPIVLVACADASISSRYGSRGANLYSIQDASISVMCMMLSATELGLGTVWVGAFDEAAVSVILKLPDNLRPVAIVPIGFPAQSPSPTPRVSRAEAVKWIASVFPVVLPRG